MYFKFPTNKTWKVELWTVAVGTENLGAKTNIAIKKN